ncbi:hypothetical protein PF005_g26590 [Phytophthora fragariae]|uniref:Secreted protein n=1 Tax=Phytophthora fragariae TaxID=53985 RepID=A0A6A3Q5Y7_9STRA|nr:hypothetical protein PF003_g27273 [Phytophthora fragariae]KAE8922175.1 hypothetical protein PF009_g27557 [Phytophthora fragariae]KAE9065738.1 hypothetical protein PF010_g28079 [Phytophthora fragariae]KAE9069003.1 hypothetical protein PF007_g27482 [Phytophthora fragariae]KAE9075752.1 hypothetical protein PF006_g28272 [Phytophthora fragariae]
MQLATASGVVITWLVLEYLGMGTSGAFPVGGGGRLRSCCARCTALHRRGCFSTEAFGWNTYIFGCTTTTIRSSTPNLEIEYPLTE